MDKDIILVGAFSEMVELCQLCGFNIVGIIDNFKEGCFRNIPIIGTDTDANKLILQYGSVPLVLTPDSPVLREKLVSYYSSFGWKFTSVISPFATISISAKIGVGVVIQSGCNVSADTIIGDFVKMNTQSNVMHDSVIGSFATIAPRAVVLGRVNIGLKAYIGANSTILPSLLIGNESVVGAGAVVTKDVSNSVVVKGIPAR